MYSPNTPLQQRTAPPARVMRLAASADEDLGRLLAAARLDLADFLTFEVGADAERPDITNEGMQYEGMRFRAEGRLAGKPYGDPFGVDTAWQGCYPAGRWGERATSRLRLAYFALNVADTTAMSVQDTSRYGALG